MDKLPCQTLPAWLKANLGKDCLAPLTGTDSRALRAAVQIVDLFNQCDPGSERAVLVAFRNVVECMQPKTRELAYHAIAHLTEWHFREALWMQAGLEPLARVRVCAFEPGGSQR